MKKRLLAGLLSFTILTAEILPVAAIDDAVVSENAVAEEEAAEASESAETEEEATAVSENAAAGEAAAEANEDAAAGEEAAEANEDAAAGDESAEAGGEAVRENVTEEEAPAEENADEAAPAEEDADPAVTVFDLDDDDTIILSDKVISEADGVEEHESIILVKLPEKQPADAASSDENSATEDRYLAESSTPAHIYVNSQTDRKVDAGYYIDSGNVYSLTATVTYYSHISYRGKKIKACSKESDTNQLYATVDTSGLYGMVSRLSPYDANCIRENGVLKCAVEFSYNTKKNKNANSGSYFTLKASVKTKIAKQLGITGRSLRILKKAVKQFNKYAKKDRIFFTIDPLDFDTMLKNNYVCYSMRWINNPFKITSFVIRCCIKPEEPYLDMSKWTKPSSKEVTAKKLDGITYTVCAKNTNYQSNGYYKLYFSLKDYGSYKEPVLDTCIFERTR